MSKTEMDLWQDRLVHAERVWQEHGIIPSVNESEAPISAILNAYRNVHWSESWGGIPHDELMSIPVVFSVTNTLLAQVFARHPIIDVYSSNQEGSSGARIMEILCNHENWLTFGLRQ